MGESLMQRRRVKDEVFRYVNFYQPVSYTHLEAVRFKAQLIGTEHILIAIIKESESVALRLLNTIGVNTVSYTHLTDGGHAVDIHLLQLYRRILSC